MAVTIIAVNQTGSPISFARLNMPDGQIPGSGQVTLTDYNTVVEIQNSSELLTQIQGGNVLINDGTRLLSQAESERLLSPIALGLGAASAGTVLIYDQVTNTLTGSSVSIDSAGNLVLGGEGKLSGSLSSSHGFADVVNHTASTLAEVNTLISDATLDTNTAERPAASHGFADVVRHSSSTLAEVNSLISDATLDDITGNRTDADAIHDNVASEISAITAKGAPVANDYLIIEDSAAANVKKSVRWGTITGSGGGLVPHGLADVVNHTASTLAELNTLVSDATLDTNTAERPAAAHGFADVVRHTASTLAEVNTLISDATLYEWENDLGGTQVNANNVPDGADATAIHDNVSSEISAIAQKTTLAGSDIFLIEDSAAGNAKKRVLAGDITGSGGGLVPHGFADVVNHTASTLAEVNTLITDATLDTNTAERPAASHGFADVVRHTASTLAEVNTLVSDATLDTNTAERPAASHGFADVVRHTASTLAEVNTLISDATLYEWENDQGGTQVNANNVPDGADATAIHDNVSSEISAITQKNTPAANDYLIIEDSAAANVKKSVRWGAITGSGGGLVPHGLADVVNHTASTLAELNSLVSDATLDTNTAERPAASHGFADVVRHTASTLAEVNSLISDATLYEWENDQGGTQVNANNIPDGADATAIHDNVASEISAITAKGTPVANDYLIIEDSAAANVKKSIRLGVLTSSLVSHGFADVVNHSASTIAEVNDKVSDGNFVWELSKAVTVVSPTSDEKIALWRTNKAITITELNAAASGSTPSFTWNIRHGTDKSATGNAVMSASVTTTSQTAGDKVNTFTSGDPTIPAQSWIWLRITATGGTTDEANVTVFYTVD